MKLSKKFILTEQELVSLLREAYKKCEDGFEEDDVWDVIYPSDDDLDDDDDDD